MIAAGLTRAIRKQRFCTYTFLLFYFSMQKTVAAILVTFSPTRYTSPGFFGGVVKYLDISLVISAKIDNFALANGKMPFGV